METAELKKKLEELTAGMSRAHAIRRGYCATCDVFKSDKYSHFQITGHRMVGLTDLEGLPEGAELPSGQDLTKKAEEKQAKTPYGYSPNTVKRALLVRKLKAQGFSTREMRTQLGYHPDYYLYVVKLPQDGKESPVRPHSKAAKKLLPKRTYRRHISVIGNEPEPTPAVNGSGVDYAGLASSHVNHYLSGYADLHHISLSDLVANVKSNLKGE